MLCRDVGIDPDAAMQEGTLAAAQYPGRAKALYWMRRMMRGPHRRLDRLSDEDLELVFAASLGHWLRIHALPIERTLTRALRRIAWRARWLSWWYRLTT